MLTGVRTHEHECGRAQNDVSRPPHTHTILSLTMQRVRRLILSSFTSTSGNSYSLVASRSSPSFVWKIPWSTQTLAMVILLMVSVPVLSEQIHEVDPCVNKSVEEKKERKKNVKKIEREKRKRKQQSGQRHLKKRVTRKQQQHQQPPPPPPSATFKKKKTQCHSDLK